MIRLLHVTKREFHEFPDRKSVPEYVILSHRWNHSQEAGRYRALDVTYEEFGHTPQRGSRIGLEKIEKACETVRDLSQETGHNIEWIWIDSCCIDKSNNAEHEEAINSMYEWYARSFVCIAYLEDVETSDDFASSEWFLRGWTLQELIAPERVLFYNKHWQGCGSRNSYQPHTRHNFQDRSCEIAEITRIDHQLLQRQDRTRIKMMLDHIPACQKMSWASNRTTTHVEDMAYCLIGIFDYPHMYLKRGEGKGAFIRLQEEILKQSNDLTLFAWNLPSDSSNLGSTCISNFLGPDAWDQDDHDNAPFFDTNPRTILHGAFACGPCHFKDAYRIEAKQAMVYNEEVAITSKGVKFKTPLLGSDPCLPFKLPLYCSDRDSNKALSIELRLLGGSIYARSNCMELIELQDHENAIPSQDEIYLTQNVRRFLNPIRQWHRHAIRLPETILNTFERMHVSPGYLWSKGHSLLITNGCRFFVGCAKYQYEETNITLIFGLDHLQRPWFCLSTADSQFGSHVLEGRKAYLERVWRRAYQHPLACLYRGRWEPPKPFTIHAQGSSFKGFIGVNERLYCGDTIYEVSFTSSPLQPSSGPENRTDVSLSNEDISRYLLHGLEQSAQEYATLDFTGNQTLSTGDSTSYRPSGVTYNLPARSRGISTGSHPDHTYKAPSGIPESNAQSGTDRGLIHGQSSLTTGPHTNAPPNHLRQPPYPDAYSRPVGISYAGQTVQPGPGYYAPGPTYGASYQYSGPVNPIYNAMPANSAFQSANVSQSNDPNTHISRRHSFSHSGAPTGTGPVGITSFGRVSNHLLNISGQPSNFTNLNPNSLQQQALPANPTYLDIAMQQLQPPPQRSMQANIQPAMYGNMPQPQFPTDNRLPG